ncbi:1,4-alpha-glucan branching protein GlgB [Rhodocista pekingensis]|uniref:1,4-alpha-glucan branching enzyme GlgB n=1 Tax=Rhodocista pekingensis TaxID=201185 RepID=A0ABW2KZF4_9PROT
MSPDRHDRPSRDTADLVDAPFEAAIHALVHADHGDPFSVLGPHDGPDGTWQVRGLFPDARTVEVVDAGTGETLAEARRVHPHGFWLAAIDGEQRPYRLRIDFGTGPMEFEDAYRFGPWLGDLDRHLFAEGTHLRLWERLGAHPTEIDGVAGTAFAVWAPNARRVSVVGDFCNWDGRRLPMRLHHGIGIWEIFVPRAGRGDLYKFEIKGPDGTMQPLKADPMAFSAEPPPRTASVVHGTPPWTWADGDWLERRPGTSDLRAPMAIYEVHLGSWKRGPDNRYLTYRELADELIPYVAGMGFTHIEMLPVTEYPFDGSWGYQPVGLFAPTSRFGTPEDFRHFVEAAHRAGIGVLLDWVPGHFPADPHGLGLFDGTHLYEHADPRQGFHQDWNTLIYNYGRREVQNFLLANALFWLDRYHLDGLRVDAVASMLYLDYSRKAGEWVPNRFGGRENLDAIELLRRTNELAYGEHPGAITVAEESTAWPAVSRPTYLGGLGFGYKWNMGWMHDTLNYMSKDPVHRRWHHHNLTFGLIYAFSENFVLPLSHDEVVHGKGSLLNKMPGDRWRKFANLRAYFAFMWTHPGKKLLFMGGEFAQEREWSHDRGLDWFLLSLPDHEGVQRLIRDLNHLYRELPALHRLDCDPAGFEWLEANDSETSVLAFLRKDDEGRMTATVCNFTPLPRHGYRLGVPAEGWWAERLNTDAERYGGSNVGNGGGVRTEEVPAHGRPYSLSLTLPPLGTVVLEFQAGTA